MRLGGHRRGQTCPAWLVLRTAQILLLLATGAACGREAPPPGPDEEPQPVVLHATDIHRVGVERIESGPVISGSLAPVREATVGARVTGRVLETFAEAGDRVARGARLARIDDASLREALLSARSAVRAAGESVDAARRDEQRAETLLEAGAIPRQEVDRARTELIRAEAQLADARARLSLAQEDLDDTTVRAPFAGHIGARQVTAGSLVQPGTPLFMILDLSTLQLEAAVPAQHLGHLRVGSTVDFTVTGFPDRTFSATIDRISPAADPVTRQIMVFVNVPNEDGRLAAGLFAEGRLATETREAVAVPFGAIDELGPEAAVMRLAADGRVERVPVTLGLRDEQFGRAEVVDGLAEGDRVMLGAARTLTPGTPVHVEDASERAAGGH